ncbi:hypothetical protein TEA_008253 [Camellia sinensis var. sinensis]|uniref:Uncharacterized protein n=1 Tax=Camellia sinensis var. sinensis TaxID=542762 RepID=A0A4S4DDD1_CAMSN|nr:hypothetical protein TEA_008253 [Camellia sinensis var. sinensis]
MAYSSSSSAKTLSFFRFLKLKTDFIDLLLNCFVHPKIPFQIQKYDRSRDYNGIRLESKMIPRAKIQYFLGGGFHTRYATSPGGNHHELSSGNDFLEEPFWLTLIKEAFWALKSLFVFLLEQPSQLKYIEWPSFHSTLRFRKPDYTKLMFMPLDAL